MDTKIAYTLIELRQKNGLTQQALADALGAELEMVSSWEQAKSIPDNHMLRRLSELYAISFEDILTPEEPPQAPLPPQKEPAEEAAPPKAPSPSLEKPSGGNSSFKTFIAAYPIFVVIFFLLAGFTFGLWRVAWLMFLTIPLVPLIFKASGGGRYDAAKTFTRLLDYYYPGIVATLYLNFGVIFGWWHPTWILFLSIPLFYIFRAATRKPEQE